MSLRFLTQGSADTQDTNTQMHIATRRPGRVRDTKTHGTYRLTGTGTHTCTHYMHAQCTSICRLPDYPHTSVSPLWLKSPSPALCAHEAHTVLSVASLCFLQGARLRVKILSLWSPVGANTATMWPYAHSTACQGRTSGQGMSSGRRDSAWVSPHQSFAVSLNSWATALASWLDTV